MRVEHESDRMEMPEECDYCGSKVKLERFSYYGPGHNVDWLCKYCAASFHKEETRSIAAMFNKLEQIILDANKQNHS